MRRPKLTRRMWSCLLAGALVGCSTALTPATPLVGRVSPEGATLTLVELRRLPFDGPVGGEMRMTLALDRIAPGTRYLGARLTRNDGLACSDGQLARAVHVERGSLRPLSASSLIALTFGFRHSATALGASRLDVTLAMPNGEERCVQVPVTAPPGERDWAQATQLTWTFGARGELRPGVDAHGVASVLTFPLAVGVTLGRLHPELELGLALGRCKGCALASDDNRDSGVPLHVAAGVDSWLWSRGQLAFGVGLGYRATSVWSPTDAGARHAWIHGPFLRPALALMPPAPFNPERGRASAGPHISLEAPLGYSWDQSGPASLSVGLGLRFSGTL